MTRAAGGAARRRGGRRDGAAAAGEEVRKGPWMAEEDEVLLEHVRAHGPRDWSSIRSKGLLRRTGKSCRLRWVNKLRPNLKTGCKFSPEEERVVLELQAQFGNKWARIATYLPGRTDNDVKNFWSTRQKRLARLLRAPIPGRSRKSGNAKAPSSSVESQPAMCRQGLLHDQALSMGNTSGGQCSASAPLMELQGIPHHQTASGFFSFEAPLPLQILPPPTEDEASSSNAAQLAPQLPFNPHPCHLLDFPGLWERYDTAPGFVGTGAMDGLAYQELLPVVQQPAPMMMMPFFGMGCAHDAVKTETRNDFFDDLPPDMFDSLDQLPPSTTNSQH